LLHRRAELNDAAAGLSVFAYDWQGFLMLDYIPENSKQIFQQLWQDIVNLNWKWQQYRKLFGAKKCTIELLNRTANSFAWMLHEVLLKDVLLSISKLIDPASQGKHVNLALAQLRTGLSPALHTELTKKLTEIENEIQGQCRDIQTLRNKVFAHRDLDVATGQVAMLDMPSRAQIEVVLKLITKYVNTYSLAFGDTTFGFAVPDLIPGDASSLLFKIELADWIYREHRSIVSAFRAARLTSNYDTARDDDLDD
jgi:hypothetical protein